MTAAGEQLDFPAVVTDAGDGIAADHADWVNAGFITGPAK
jgi:hypothetical protein